MLARLVILLALLPLLDLLLLVRIGARIGFAPTLALVLATGLLGAALARHEGLRVLRSWNEALAAGRMPSEGALGGVLVLAGAALLAAPGVLTDVAGLLLVLPPTRRLIGARVRARLARRVQAGGRPAGPRADRPAREQIIDVEARPPPEER